MNDELRERLTSYLDAVEASASTAGEFVAEQTPLVAQEYLAWYFWGAVFLAAISLVGALVCLPLVVWGIRKLTKNDDGSDAGIPAVMFGGFGMACGLCCLIQQAYFALHVTIAPRIILLEKVADLLK